MSEPSGEKELVDRILTSSGLKRTRAPWTISPRYPWEPEAFPVIGYAIAGAVILGLVLLHYLAPVRDLSPSEICAEERQVGKRLTASDCQDIWTAQHTSTD